MKTRACCQCALHVSLLLHLSHWSQSASKLPRDQGPFLEMLLNHHNPPKVFAFKVLLVSPHQLHSWQLPAAEPNLFKGGAVVVMLAQALRRTIKDFKVQEAVLL